MPSCNIGGATTRERDEYKRAHVLTLATWEIRQVNAGERDPEVRRFIDERVAKEWGDDPLAAWHGRNE